MSPTLSTEFPAKAGIQMRANPRPVLEASGSPPARGTRVRGENKALTQIPYDSSLDRVVCLGIGLGHRRWSLAATQILPQGHGQTGLALSFCRTSRRALLFGFARLFGHAP